MSDMIVKLYDIKPFTGMDLLEQKGIKIKRAIVTDKAKILKFIEDNFNEKWIYECERALFHDPVGCFVAVKDKQVVGFACYDATAKDFFGPIGVREDLRGNRVGAALLHACMNAMRENGYAYAIIGWTAEKAVPFYQREVGAVFIEGSALNRSIYQNMIEMD